MTSLDRGGETSPLLSEHEEWYTSWLYLEPRERASSLAIWAGCSNGDWWWFLEGQGLSVFDLGGLCTEAREEGLVCWMEKHSKYSLEDGEGDG